MGFCACCACVCAFVSEHVCVCVCLCAGVGACVCVCMCVWERCHQDVSVGPQGHWMRQHTWTLHADVARSLLIKFSAHRALYIDDKCYFCHKFVPLDLRSLTNLTIWPSTVNTILSPHPLGPFVLTVRQHNHHSRWQLRCPVDAVPRWPF